MAGMIAEREPARDLVRAPVSFVFWWCLPVAVAVLSDSLGFPLHAVEMIWAAALAWMAAGCFLNAYRCHRLHCYISGPALLAGAVAAGTLALGVSPQEPHALNYVLAAATALVALSFLPELVWRKYV